MNNIKDDEINIIGKENNFRLIEKIYKKGKFITGNILDTSGDKLDDNFFNLLYLLHIKSFPDEYEKLINDEKEKMLNFITDVNNKEKINIKDNNDVKYKLFKHNTILNDNCKNIVIYISDNDNLSVIAKASIATKNSFMGGKVNISNFCVDENFRNLGIGKYLLKQCNLSLINNGFIPSIYVDKKNKDFCEKCGFKETKRLINHKNIIFMSM